MLRRCALAVVLLGTPAALWAKPQTYRLRPEEQRIDALVTAGKPLEAREAARAYLAGHPDSFLACEVAGMVYLNHDGDLPKALYWFTRARGLLEERYRGAWGPGSPSGFYSAILRFQFRAQYGLERYEDALATLAWHDAFFNRPHPEEAAWSLMKLGRFQEARQRIREALASGEAEDRVMALNTLSALEAELDRPEEAFHAQMLANDLDRKQGKQVDCSLLRNAGDGARNLGRLDQAEQFFLEATTAFDPGTVSNPWGDLAGLYLEEQRFPEAMDAVKRMHLWAFHSLPLGADTHWNLRQTLTGALLYQCGCTEEALAIARRLQERPDRLATGSSRDGQRAAGTQLFHFQVLQDALARDEEEASYLPWKRLPGLLARQARHALEAVLAKRRAGSLLLANQERLAHSLRLLAIQSVVDVAGGEILLPRIVGPGLVEAELNRLLARKGPASDRERGFLLLELGALRLERGEARKALEALEGAELQLPREFRLLHTQLQALKAKARLDQGDLKGALAPLTEVLRKDGGEVRRQRLSLPCDLQASGPLAQRTAGILARSPRLRPGSGGFRVSIAQTSDGGLQGRLGSPQGETLCQFQVPRGADPDATAREFCRQFHHKAFGPRIDLTQQQIRSLEGSTLASQSAEENLKGILGD
jgi:hypothetical protein